MSGPLSGKLIVGSIIVATLFACARPVPVTRPEDALEQVSWNAPSSAVDDREFRDMALAVRQSLEYFKKLPPETIFFFGPDRVTALDQIVTLQNFLLIIENDTLPVEQKIDQVKRDFTLYRAVGSDGSGRVLFTGYYEPMLSCRTASSDAYKYPLYRRPDDIIEIDLSLFNDTLPKNKIYGRLDGKRGSKRVIPYYSREEINDSQALASKDLEILWCNDPVAIYFLQVQGSGKADLGDGNVVSVLYDGQNGRPYKSIGKYLIDTGAVARENMTMQAIRDYLRAHPEELSTILNQNPSYVFFRMDMGPSLGNIGVPLTAGRSIATDSRLFPKGALALMVTTLPAIENGAVKPGAPLVRFVMNQDTGGAIKGAGRADLFWGQGPEAEQNAGAMQQEGELFFLVRKK